MQDLKRFLLQSRFLKEVDENVVDELLNDIAIVRIQSGKDVFTQGSSADGFYIILNGRIQVIQETNGRQNIVNELGRGECFGELALINDKPRAATIRAVRDCELAMLSKDKFFSVLQRFPQTAVTLLKVVGNLIAHPEAPATVRKEKAVALLPCCSSEKIKVFIRNYIEQISTQEHVLHLSAENLDQMFGAPVLSRLHEDDVQVELARWLNEQENQYHQIVFEAQPEIPRWTEICCRQADISLVVAFTGSSIEPAHSVIIGVPKSIGTYRELVLISQNGETMPTNSQAWIEATEADYHHQVRLDNTNDYAKIRRRMRGESIGLVLGGGGARGLAHIGVLRAMEELGIPIDAIGGTSMGALIGVQYAAGMSVNQIIANCKKGWVEDKSHRAFTFPIISLMSARRAARNLRRIFGKQRLEDMWTSTFCITSDLTAMSRRVHKTGKAWLAVMAGSTLPGILPPIIDEDKHILVDGGLIDNLPTEIMKEENRGPIIAVDVSTTTGVTSNLESSLPPSGWWFLLQVLLFRRKKVRFPNIAEVLFLTTRLGSDDNTRKSMEVADLLLLPQSDVGFLDLERIDEAAEAGYQHAFPILRKWWQEHAPRDAGYDEQEALVEDEVKE